MGDNNDAGFVGLIFTLAGLGIVLLGGVVEFFVGPLVPSIPLAGVEVSDLVVAGIVVALIGLGIIVIDILGGGGGKL